MLQWQAASPQDLLGTNGEHFAGWSSQGQEMLRMMMHQQRNLTVAGGMDLNGYIQVLIFC